MYKILLFLLIPLLAFSQYNPIDANVKGLWYYGGNVATTNDSVDTWSDLSTSGLNPTIATTNRPVLAKFDGITFDGTDDYLTDTPNDSIKPGTGDFSIEGRIYAANWVTSGNDMVYSLYQNSNNRIVVYVGTTSRLGIYVIQGSGTTITTLLTSNNALTNATKTF